MIANKILSRVIPDDIILLHDSYPGSPEKLDHWLCEIRSLIKGLHGKGFQIVPLSELIKRPVFIKKKKG